MILCYQKSPDQDGFEVIVLNTNTEEGQAIVWKGIVSEVINNDR